MANNLVTIIDKIEEMIDLSLYQWVDVGDYKVRQEAGRLVDIFGNRAVVVARGYGIGWSTQDSRPNPLDPWMALAILSIREEAVNLSSEMSVVTFYRTLIERWEYGAGDDPSNRFDAYGLHKCQIEWVRKGMMFYLSVHDGYESVHFVTPPAHKIYEG